MSFYKRPRKRFSPSPMVKALTHFFMGILYLLVGMAVIVDAFTYKMITFFDTRFNLIFATLALLYGVFRIYRAWILYKNNP